MMFLLGTGAQYVLPKETGPKALPTPTAPKHKRICSRRRAMPVDGNITARGDSTSVEIQDTWKSLGELARKLAEKLGRDA